MTCIMPSQFDTVRTALTGSWVEPTRRITPFAPVGNPERWPRLAEVLFTFPDTGAGTWRSVYRRLRDDGSAEYRVGTGMHPTAEAVFALNDAQRDDFVGAARVDTDDTDATDATDGIDGIDDVLLSYMDVPTITSTGQRITGAARFADPPHYVWGGEGEGGFRVVYQTLDGAEIGHTTFGDWEHVLGAGSTTSAVPIGVLALAASLHPEPRVRVSPPLSAPAPAPAQPQAEQARWALGLVLNTNDAGPCTVRSIICRDGSVVSERSGAPRRVGDKCRSLYGTGPNDVRFGSRWFESEHDVFALRGSHQSDFLGVAITNAG